MLPYILAAVTGIIGLVIFFIINGSKGEVKNKKVLLFNLIFAVSITAFGCAGLIATITDSIWWFVSLQLIFLIPGALFYYLLDKDFFGKLKNPIISQLALVVANTAFGFIGFALLFKFFQQSDLAIYYGMATFAFLIPYGFMLTFNQLAAMPPEIHKIWYYPLDKEEPDTDSFDFSNMYLLELEFSKTPNAAIQKTSRIKAPVDLIFGEWYRSFINNFNYKYEQDPIQFLDGNKKPYGWVFFTKTESFWQTKRFIDPDLSIKNNKLTEKIVIVAKRVEV